MRHETRMRVLSMILLVVAPECALVPLLIFCQVDQMHLVGAFEAWAHNVAAPEDWRSSLCVVVLHGSNPNCLFGGLFSSSMRLFNNRRQGWTNSSSVWECWMVLGGGRAWAFFSNVLLNDQMVQNEKQKNASIYFMFALLYVLEVDQRHRMTI